MRPIGPLLLSRVDDILEPHTLGARREGCRRPRGVAPVAWPALRARCRRARARALCLFLALLVVARAAPDLVRAAEHCEDEQAHQDDKYVRARALLLLRRVRVVRLVQDALRWVLAPGTLAVLNGWENGISWRVFNSKSSY